MASQRKRNGGQRGPKLFDPRSRELFQLSRYRLERFVECPQCFWLELRKGLKRPEPHPYTLNSAVDLLVKREFDIYRKRGAPHPLMTRFGIHGIPFDHPKLADWRLTTAHKGMRYIYPGTNLDIMGSPDDIWLIAVPEPCLAVVDTKATSAKEIRPIEDAWWDSYRRQLDIYIWLLDRQGTGYSVSRTGYFLLLNGIADRENFNLILEFKPMIVTYHANDGWVEGTIREAHACLMDDSAPIASVDCELCSYRHAAGKLEP